MSRTLTSRFTIFHVITDTVGQTCTFMANHIDEISVIAM
jgi:hypothetical protein